MKEWANEETKGRTNTQKNEKTKKQTKETGQKWTNFRTNRPTDERTNERTDDKTNKQTNVNVNSSEEAGGQSSFINWNVAIKYKLWNIFLNDVKKLYWNTLGYFYFSSLFRCSHISICIIIL